MGHRLIPLQTGRMIFDGRTYAVVCDETREAFAVDPDLNAAEVLDTLRAEGAKLAAVLLTHGHFDHITACDALRDETGAYAAIHRLDAPLLGDARLNVSSRLQRAPVIQRPAERLLEDGERLAVGSLTIEVIHTPGHTPGSCCFLVGNDLLAGDTLFLGSYGRTDFPGGDLAALRASIGRLFKLGDNVAVWPGHGGPTTIGRERLSNPILI